MGGFFGGALTGILVVGSVSAYVSLTSPLPVRPDVSSVAPATRGGESSEPDTGGSGVDPAGQDADLVELAPRAPVETEQSSDSLNSLDSEITEPGDKPKVGAATGALDKPDTASTASVTVETEAPVMSPAPGEAPSVPTDEAELAVSKDQPRQPLTPDVSETGSGLESPVETEADPVIASQPDADLSTEEVAAPTPAAQSDQAPSVDTQSSAVIPVNESPAPQTSDAAPEIAALPQIGSDETSTVRPQIGTPVVPLTERNTVPVATGETSTALNPEERPIEIYAEPFDNPENKPLMAIVLMDDAKGLGAEALQDFPYPLSFAIDPTDPLAKEKMARYRKSGFEVVLLADLPAAATAQDAEVSLSVWVDALPETVAILEGTKSGIQGNRELSGQVSAILGDTGRGLITQDNGLNTVQKLAVRAGVPAAVVFRDFDGAGQTPTIMRRFLDQAAFRAGQEGAVIMLGRVRPDTVSALLLWGLQDRVSRVALAPVSAVLTRE